MCSLLSEGHAYVEEARITKDGLAHDGKAVGLIRTLWTGARRRSHQMAIPRFDREEWLPSGMCMRTDGSRLDVSRDDENNVQERNGIEDKQFTTLRWLKC